MKNSIPPELIWACRRGMLELDMLLKGFLTQEYPHLNKEEQIAFAQLLTCQDQDLFLWLFAGAIPAETRLIDVINKIRSYAQSRF